jgi:hypothetical protein
MKQLLILALFASTSHAVFGDLYDDALKLPPKAILDSKSKVIYYLESDRRTVVAITPEGQVLWRCQPKPFPPRKFRWYVEKIDLETAGDGKEYVGVTIFESGYGGGFIDKKTGAYNQSPGVL